MPNKALLIIDVQNDFCPGGTLAVPNGDQIIPILNQYIKFFSKNKYPIFVSRDWHPRRSKHFKRYGGLWPTHCIQKTTGARFHPPLKLLKATIVLSKGMDPTKDSYSAFQGFDSKGRTFQSILAKLRIQELYVGGLATDYCVKKSVTDALKRRFKVKLLLDSVRGVDIKRGDSKLAIAEMLRLGAKKFTLKQLSR